MSDAYKAWSYGTSSLEHFGIKGQKWGVRNYQNEDGTLTAAGKARYLVGQYKVRRAEKKAAKAEQFKSDSGSWKSRDVKHLTDKELKARNQRLADESNYKRMTQSKGAKRREGLKKTGQAIFITTAARVASGIMTQNYKEIFGKTTAKLATIKASPTSQVTKKFLKSKGSGMIKSIGKKSGVKKMSRAGQSATYKFLKKIGYPVHELGFKKFVDNSAKIVNKRIAKKAARASAKAWRKTAAKTVATRFHLRKLS